MNTLARNHRSTLHRRLKEHVASLSIFFLNGFDHAEELLIDPAAHIAVRCEIDDVVASRGVLTVAKSYAQRSRMLAKLHPSARRARRGFRNGQRQQFERALGRFDHKPLTKAAQRGGA